MSELPTHAKMSKVVTAPGAFDGFIRDRRLLTSSLPGFGSDITNLGEGCGIARNASAAVVLVAWSWSVLATRNGHTACMGLVKGSGF
jgi:hypothetical protein